MVINANIFVSNGLAIIRAYRGLDTVNFEFDRTRSFVDLVPRHWQLGKRMIRPTF